ncbi:MAG TPA: SpoIIE family protein phosphatase [Anaerolineales bacterium]|jgi:sigma-B regulation protein RsbU (phosphoserine phosphatase)
MRKALVSEIQKSIAEKSVNLEQWLESSPVDEKETCLCDAGEQEVHNHLEVIGAVMQKTESETFGICEVCHAEVDSNLLELDYTATVCLGCLSEQEQRDLETELELSQTVQRALMPQVVPAISGLDAAAFSRPAQIVSGDYFDFIPLADGSFALTIADAMGHGIASSMFMSSLQATLHVLLPESQSASLALERINHFYLHNVNYTTFVTIFIGIFNPRNRMLTYFNAGHHPAALVRQGSDQVTWLAPNGAAIGVIEDYRITPGQVQLESGDALLLYTDGIPEAINASSKEFGNERLGQLVIKYASQPAADIITSLRQELAQFIANRPLIDDITMVACKVTG